MKMERKTFRIGEIANELGVESFVIRFWEKQFGITTSRSEGGQRYYTADEMEKFSLIKELLYKKKFTIAGARKYLETRTSYRASTLSSAQDPYLKSCYALMIDLKKQLQFLMRFL